MDDWDLYALNNKLEAIKYQEKRIADSLDSSKRWTPNPNLRLLSGKTRWKIVAGIAIFFLGIWTVGFLLPLIVNIFV